MGYPFLINYVIKPFSMKHSFYVQMTNIAIKNSQNLELFIFG